MANENVLEGVPPRESPQPQDFIRHSNGHAPPAISSDNHSSYAQEAFAEKKAIPESHPLDNSSEPSGQDVEAGRKAAFKSAARRYYKSYFKHVLYAVIWLLFTG
jgi:CNT family concentrative nucleoside transporter